VSVSEQSYRLDSTSHPSGSRFAEKRVFLLCDPCPAKRDPENLRFQAVSKPCCSGLMVVSQPLVAHGVGSQDVDDVLNWAGTVDQSGLVVLDQPQWWFTVPTRTFIQITSRAERVLDPSSHSIPLWITCWPKHYEPLPHWSSASSGGNKPGARDRAAGQIRMPPNKPMLNIYSHSSCCRTPWPSHCSSIGSAPSDNTIHNPLRSQID
jgi:hypothetical protein